MFGHNRGLGLFSQGMGGGIPEEPGLMPSRQLNLVASEGFSGNGMATIGGDNTFSVIAHLPPTHTVSPYAPALYAAYLVDNKGKNGFYAGALKPAGNGMYQANFRSTVPLAHYDKVVISLENPQGIMQAPQGPIVMKVKEGFFGGLGPVKKVGGDMWGRVKGFVGSRFGGKAESGEQAAIPQTQVPPSPPVQPYTQPYARPAAGPYPGGAYQQPAYGGQGFSRRGFQPGVYQGGYVQQPYPRPTGSVNSGGYPQGGYPQGGYAQQPQGLRQRQGGYAPQAQPNYVPGNYQQPATPQTQPIAAQADTPAAAHDTMVHPEQEQNVMMPPSMEVNTDE